MATRIVDGPLLGPRDEPLSDFIVKFAVTKAADGGVQYTPDGHFPWMETEVITDENGDFEIEMVTGITYAIQWWGSVVDGGHRVKMYPPGIGFKLEFVVPHGDTRISLQTIRALGPIKPDDPSVAQIIEAAIADMESEYTESIPGLVSDAMIDSPDVRDAVEGIAEAKAEAVARSAVAATDFEPYVSPLVPPLVDSAISETDYSPYVEPLVPPLVDSAASTLDYTPYVKPFIELFAPPSQDDMEYLSRDRFVGSDGTLLTSRVPDVGASWVHASGTPLQLQGGAVVSPVGNGLAVQVGLGDDVVATAQIKLGTTGGAGVIFRYVDSANYWYAWFEMSVAQLRIYSVNSGSSIMQSSVPVPSVSTGDRITMRVETFRTHVRVQIVGHVELQYDDVPPGGGVGIRMPGTTTGNRMTDFSAMPYSPPAVPSLPTITATNAPSPLEMPMMYGDTQGVHPSVIDFGSGGWEGFRYWMAWTPLTNGNTQNENPSIAVSQDGDTWQHPPGLTNPVVLWPGTGAYNSDCHLVFAEGRLVMMYRTTNHPATGNADDLWVTESPDGVAWSTPVRVLESGPGLAALVSPALVYRHGLWHLWVVATNLPSRHRLTYRTAPSPYGPWSDPIQCYMPMPAPKIDMWHIDVFDAKSRLVGVFSSGNRDIPGAGMDGNLYYAESFDGIHWNLAATPFLLNSPDGTSWDDGKLYRSSVTRTSGGYDLYYSAQSTNNKWRIGRTAMSATYR